VTVTSAAANASGAANPNVKTERFIFPTMTAVIDAAGTLLRFEARV
jgi:hypothetical protein